MQEVWPNEIECFAALGMFSCCDVAVLGEYTISILNFIWINVSVSLDVG